MLRLMKLFEKKVNMFGYGEIHPGGGTTRHDLLDAFLQHFPVQKAKSGDLDIVVGEGAHPFYRYQEQ